MIGFFVFLYMFAMIPVGIYASRRAKTVGDYITADRHLPFIMVVATTFATWFGFETFVGTGSRVAEGGLLRVIEDPFGATLCLILVGVFFAKRFFTSKGLTLGDYFRERYNGTVATILSFALVTAYFGWIAAQFVAAGAILHIALGTNITLGILIVAIVVTIYTSVGGMWSVATTNTIHAIMIIIGFIIVITEVLLKTGGIATTIAQTPPELFALTPYDPGAKDWFAWIAAWMAIGLGSIPQQDVYQRALSARSGTSARWSSISAGILYLAVAIIPMILGLIARAQYPELTRNDPDQLLYTLIFDHTNITAQVFFFGALIAVVMSTIAPALLAPATILGENIIKPFFVNISDKKRVFFIRMSLVAVAVIALVLALSKDKMYDLVGGAYSITLVTAFIPLVFGMYWKKANSLGALFAIIFGALSWQITKHYVIDPAIPPILAGLGFSLLGMLLGIFLAEKTERFKHHRTGERRQKPHLVA